MLEDYLKEKAAQKDYQALVKAFPNVANNKNYKQKINSLIKKASEIDTFFKADKMELIMKKSRIEFQEFKIKSEKLDLLESIVRTPKIYEANQAPNFPSQAGAYILSIQTFPILTIASQYGDFGLGIIFKDDFCVYSLTQKKNNGGELVITLKDFITSFGNLKDAMLFIKNKTANRKRVKLIDYVLE